MNADVGLPEPMASAAVIEQALGMTMCVYGVSAEQAARVLAWRAQATGVDLRAFAVVLVAQLEWLPAVDADTRARFDRLLLSLPYRPS
ncbi:ANTAR domain-containing protein [Nocardia sp. IFM 10818]